MASKERESVSKDPARREFLTQSSSFVALLASFPKAVLAERRSKQNINKKDLKKEPWLTLAAVFEHLLPPGSDTPGASDINVIQYMYLALQNPDGDMDDKEFIEKGIGWLNDLSKSELQKPFMQLSVDNKESLLRKIEKSRAGERWLSKLFNYLIEALLADPVYGGNKDERGWRWLKHQAGFPAPVPDKLWFRLGKAAEKNYKADS